MTIAYETGAASDPDDLITKLITFAESLGWTTGVTTTTDSIVFWPYSGPPAYYSVFWDADDIYMRGALDYDSGAAWDAQSGDSGLSVRTNVGTGPFTAYHFFIGEEDGYPHIHVALEVSAGIYRHMTFGELVKAGNYTGGAYVDSTYLAPQQVNDPDSTYSRVLCDTYCVFQTGCLLQCDVDGNVDFWYEGGREIDIGTDECTGSTRKYGLFAPHALIGPQSFNLRTPLWPMHYFVNRPSSLRSPAGRLPNMRQINMRNFAPAEIINVGGENWQVFPAFQRQSEAVSAPTISSGYYGYAYLRPS